jgi:uncharacterized membrane protein
MKKAVIYLSIIIASGLTMVTVYNTIIDARSWGSDIPASIQTARDYYAHVDPRLFFLIFGPINQLLISLAIILFWKNPGTRLYFAASFLLYGGIVILTLLYFVPHDLILFTWPIADHLEEIKVAAAQWSQMNWLRTLLGLAGVLSSIKGLDNYYRHILTSHHTQQ